MEHQPQFLSFSQRKFIGFRGRYEFDQKRVIIASGNEIVVLGMTPTSNKPFEILSSKVPGIKSEDLVVDDVD